MSRTLSNMTRSIALRLCTGSLIALAGCADSGGSTRAVDTTTPVNSGLSGLEDRPALALPKNDELMEIDDDHASIRAQIEESARQLSVYFTNLELDGPPETGSTPPPKPTSPTGGSQKIATQQPEPKQSIATRASPPQPNPDVGSADDGGVRVSLLDLAGGSEQQASEQKSEPHEQTSTTHEIEPQAEMDPVAKRDRLVRELASILSELVSMGQDPGKSALALASLETLLPEDTSKLVDQGVLSEPELATIDAVRSLLGSMTSEGELVSPDELTEQLGQIQLQLNAWAGLSIKKAALCTRVDGYGRYETFPSYRFIAGREHKVIVYTELEHFAQRESTGPDGLPRYDIELSQRLEMYLASDDLNTWNRAAEIVRDQSRNRLRDYYLTNLVTLPPTLGVGRYHLKIVMRDLIGEKVAEAIIPIEIVAQ